MVRHFEGQPSWVLVYSCQPARVYISCYNYVKRSSEHVLVVCCAVHDLFFYYIYLLA